MSGYTLTTEHLRRMWVLESNLLDHDDAGPAFDRWLAGVKADAIRETATGNASIDAKAPPANRIARSLLPGRDGSGANAR